MMAAPSIRVTNVREREVFEHPLVLLEGVVEHAHQLAPSGELLFLHAQLDAVRGSFWPVAPHSGMFKAFILLPVPGKYTLTLRLTLGAIASSPYHELLLRTFQVEFTPRATRYVVRFYYQKCIDADGEGFDAPPGSDTSDAAALAKIRFNALLLQTLTAEMFAHAGLPRRTFAVEFASDGLPFVRLLRSQFTNATARSIHDQELIRLVHEDIDVFGLDTHDTLVFKHAVILGCSTFNAETQRPEGHTALGGDKVGVFGSCGLHTWPTHLGEVTAACLDNRKIDTRTLMDDSCYRGTHWANYATGLGAFLHELGHTFGLGHADSGIMGRGFDDMNRLLCAFDIDPHCGQPGFFASAQGGGNDGRLQLNLAAVREVVTPAGAHWNVGSARLLQHCPWLSGVPKPSTHVPTVSWTRDACGPVGQGLYDGEQFAFASSPFSHREALGAIRVTAGDFLHRIQTFSRTEVAHWDVVAWHARGREHLFVLLDGEFVTRVDVRAMAYIDGVQIHTNRRASRWLGGFGGTLEVLQPVPGCAVDGFFGTLGDNYVGTLGAHCSALGTEHAYAHSPPALSTTPMQSFVTPTMSTPPVPSPTVAGLALSDGEQHTFSMQTLVLQAIAVTCDTYVESVRVLSREEHARSVLDPEAVPFSDHEHVFELVDGEHVVRVEARSGHWVDCVRFVTSLRVSPWFGGDGGTHTTALDAPVGFELCGVFGTRGDRYVGSLGALFAPTQLAASPEWGVAALSLSPQQQQQQSHAALKAFSVMTGVRRAVAAEPHASLGPAIGVVVATEGDRVTFVQSFASAQAFDELAARIYSTQPCDRVTCFPLLPNELLLQVDVSFSTLNAAIAVPSGRAPTAVIDGVCFHTTTRCSSWLGACRGDGALRFVVAPEGRAIRDLASVFTDATLTDIVGHECSAALAAATTVAQPHALGFTLDGRASVDTGSSSGDVRLESRSAFGLASAHLLKINDGDHLNCYAWDWPVASQLPRRWFLAHRVLLDKVTAVESGNYDNNSNAMRQAELLVREYIVGALDGGGGFSKAAAVPLQH